MYYLNYLIYRKYKNRFKNKSENILSESVGRIDQEGLKRIFWGDGNLLYFILAAYSHKISLNGTHICAFYYMYIRYNNMHHIVILHIMILLLSHFSRVRLCVTPQTSAHQALLPLGFSRQENWSGLPFPSPMHKSEKVKVKSLSRVRLLVTPWTKAHQAPPSMGFSRQEY